MEIQGTVRDIIQHKGREVWTTTPEASVYEAIGLMGEKNIGAVVVTDSSGKLLGVLSERDYSRKVVLKGRTSRDTLVGEILDPGVYSVVYKDPIERCMEMMTEHRIRHLPVVEDGELMGLISIGDLVRWAMESQKQTIQQLQGYISGDYPG